MRDDWVLDQGYDPASGRYGSADFNDFGRCDVAARSGYGRGGPTLYAASQPRCALAKILLHDVREPQAGYLYDWEGDRRGALHLSAIDLPPLLLANLTSTGLRAAGLSESGLFAPAVSVYPAARARALAIWPDPPAVHVLCWMSMRDNQSMALMLFGDRFASGEIGVALAPVPVAAYQEEVFGLLNELRCGLALQSATHVV